MSVKQAPMKDRKRVLKHATIAMALIAAAAVLAHLHVAAQSYYPVVRIAAPDGLTFMAVQEVTAERRKCGEANDRFVGPIKALCKQCQLVYARCERELAGLEADLMHDKPLPHHLVLSPGMRMAIVGPAVRARQNCEAIVADMVKRGAASAVCTLPRTPAKKPG